MIGDKRVLNTDPKVWDWRTFILKYGPDNSRLKLILLTLSCYMDSAGGSCFPSVDTLCKDTSLTKPTVIKYIEKAEEEGWVKKSQHGFSGQGWRRHQYTASIPDKVVKEINRLGREGGKTGGKGGKTDTKKVVKQFNPISPMNSANNSPESANPRKNSENDFTRLNETPIPEGFQNQSFFEAYQKFMDYMIEEKEVEITPRKTELHVDALMRLFKQGNDPVKVIEQTIMGDNKTFYQLRDKQFSTNDSQPQLIDGGTF